MYLLIAKNYKKSIILISSTLLLLIILIVGLKIFVDKTPQYNVIPNDNLSVSFPFTFIISDIYSNNYETAPYIQTSTSGYKNFIDFKCTDEGFEFSYPSTFEISPSSFPGSEIVCHIDFKNISDMSKKGFVQVWKLPYSIEEFLESSKENAMVDFIDFNSNKISVNSLDGYLWDYTFYGASGKYKALEAFLFKNSKLYRISYFVPLSQYNTNEFNTFWDIVKSLKIK